MRAFAQLATYDSARKFSSWLLSIAAHYCVDQLRRRRITWLSLDSVFGLDWAWLVGDGPEQVAVDGEERDEIRRLLHLLPAKYRLVLVLRYWYDMSYAEIGQVTGMSEAAVKTRLHRAREMLSEHLLQEDPGRTGDQRGAQPRRSQNGAVQIVSQRVGADG